MMASRTKSLRSKRRYKAKPAKASGIALLIAIFVLLLVAVVGIAMVVASGTESALTGNYHASTAAYYAATAGLEEARGRLSPKNLKYFGTTDPNFLPPAGTTWDLGYVRYVINPLPGETVDPLSGNSNDYPDNEYNTEFMPGYSLAVAAGNGTVQYANSVNVGAGFPGPLYKWVRINAVTEQSLGFDVDGINGLDNTVPVFYDGTELNMNGIGQQALEVTALAALPNGTRKMVQYIVGPTSKIQDYLNTPPSPSLYFYAAVTLLGSNTTWNFPYSDYTYFFVDGNDNATCPSGATAGPSQFALGVSSSAEPAQDGGQNKMPRNPPAAGNYTGLTSNFPPPPMATPSIGDLSAKLPLNLQKPSGIEALIQFLNDNADVVINGPATGSDLPSTMSATNPATVFVNGDLTLYGATNGYGILVVTGKFNYTSTDNWKGLVFIIGQGWATEVAGGGSGGRFDGAVFIAESRDSSGSVWSDVHGLGDSYIDFNNGRGSSFYYSACWIHEVLKPTNFKILSFHEIPQ